MDSASFRNTETNIMTLLSPLFWNLTGANHLFKLPYNPKVRQSDSREHPGKKRPNSKIYYKSLNWLESPMPRQLASYFPRDIYSEHSADHSTIFSSSETVFTGTFEKRTRNIQQEGPDRHRLWSPNNYLKTLPFQHFIPWSNVLCLNSKCEK